MFIFRKVDVDEFSGLCYVGNSDKKNLGGYVLVFLFFYFILGILFFLVGFIVFFWIWIVLKNKEIDINKFEKFMVWIGVFFVLYIVLVIFVVVCYFYEYVNMEWWCINVLCC